MTGRIPTVCTGGHNWELASWQSQNWFLPSPVTENLDRFWLEKRGDLKKLKLVDICYNSNARAAISARLGGDTRTVSL
jgi:hypothetical protein